MFTFFTWSEHTSQSKLNKICVKSMPNIISKRRQNNRLIALNSIIMQGKSLEVHYFHFIRKIYCLHHHLVNSVYIQSNLHMWSPLLSNHLYYKVTFFLFGHIKSHMNWTSFKRIPLLWGHLFFVPKMTS